MPSPRSDDAVEEPGGAYTFGNGDTPMNAPSIKWGDALPLLQSPYRVSFFFQEAFSRFFEIHGHGKGVRLRKKSIIPLLE